MEKSLRYQSIYAFLFMTPVVLTASVFSDVGTDHGLDDLIVRIGDGNQPTGLNVQVGHVEADTASGHYGPDPDHEEFIGKIFTFRSGTTGISNHATNVGKRMYGSGNAGIAPDVNLIEVYSAEGWATNDFLRVGTGSNPSSPPGNVELFNNSWIASFGSNTIDSQALRRADWSIDTHNVMLLNGVPNNGGDSLPLMSYGFNCVSVGLSDGTHISGVVPNGFDQTGMQVPLIVATQGSSSNATGVVSAITALLVETRETHPNTESNFFATFSETMKAVLLTGGNHQIGWTNNPISSGANRGRTSQPIDDVFGVGIANIDRSHRVLTGGQFASSTVLSGLEIAPTAGWDTAASSNNQSRYIRFNVSSPADEVSIVLTWHQKANTGFGSYSLADLDLELLRYNNGKPTSLVGDSGLSVYESGNVVSESEIDTVEHLYLRNLASGDYVLKISRSDSAAGSRVFSVGWLFPESDGGVPGDLNGDGVVEVNDLLILIAGWGACSGECPGDLSGDGIVNVSDILLLLSFWS
jgi:hypothetical protein